VPNNQSNNYFGDITEFFLKAKREENIVIDENRKNAIRANLMQEITKANGLQVQNANIENPEIVTQSPVFNPAPVATAGMMPIVDVQENIAPIKPVATQQTPILTSAEPTISDAPVAEPKIENPSLTYESIDVQPQQPQQQPEQFSEVIGPAYMRSPNPSQTQEESQSLPTYEEEYDDDEETFQDKFFDFWYTWQKRLVTIPIALFTIVAIVYAASNLGITFKKTPVLTPTQDIQSHENIVSNKTQPVEQTDIETSTQPTEDIKNSDNTTISDNPVIDQIENYTPKQEESRSLTKISEPVAPTQETKISTNSTTRTPTIETTSQITSITTTSTGANTTPATQPTTQNTDQATQVDNIIQTQDTPLPTTDSAAQPKPNNQVIEADNQSLDSNPNTQTEKITQQPAEKNTLDATPISTPITSTFSDISTTEFINEQPAQQTESTTIPEKEIEAEIEKRSSEQIILSTTQEQSDAFSDDYAAQNEPLSKQTNSEIVFIKEDSEAYPIYYYRDSTLKSDPDFDKEILDKISQRKGPESVSVYYLSETQVLVEVKDSGISKWYLFTKVGDLWTIQKYEKDI